MAVILREFVGDIPTQINTLVQKEPQLKEALIPLKNVKKGAIVQLIEGIHEGPTRNYTWYKKEGLISSIDSWTSPYKRPLIMHHNEEDGKIIGRVLKVEYREGNTRNGKGALIFTCYVPDKEGIEQIKDGRLSTVSVGAIATDIRCSICGEPLDLDEDGIPACGHMKGQVYEGKICYWVVYDMEAKELSYVIVPSDKYAHNLETFDAEEYFKKNKINIKEGVAINMSEAAQKGQVIDENVKKEATTVATGEGEKNNEQTPVNPETKETKKEANLTENEKRIKELEDQVEALTAEKEQLIADKEAMKVQVDRATKNLEDVQKDINATKEELKNEVALKEALEAEMITMKNEIREAKENELNSLREKLGRAPLLKESLSSRSDDSLKDAILDLKEELGSVTALKNVEPIKDPTAIKEKNENKTDINVKENKTVGNINLEESITNTLYQLF